ncbi:hypothetical protein QUF58_13320 [Anaerolineales bacterium HSG24]|nr:hypothetical protein [Anaerolineales bacterium HSG24]
MPQLIKGDLTTKTPAEFDYQGLRGTPYCVIYTNDILKKNRIYLLDTRDKLYYPLAEWDKGDFEASEKWYKYLLSINDKIGKERYRLKKEGNSWSVLDKVEQIVPDEDRMIKDLENDAWTLMYGR